MPDLTLERAAGGTVAGIDEVGRGPWAGPVLAGAVIFPEHGLPPELAGAIDDSKRLSPARRSTLDAAIREHAEVALGSASVEEIDRLNILQASLLAMARAVAALEIRPGSALVDGNRAPELAIPTQTVIGGDGKSLSIAAASIVAKVARDRLMTELARSFPGFGWERNFGYGTPEHRRALDRHGVTAHHRASFAPIRALISRS
jgi:ribonuclease HII